MPDRQHRVHLLTVLRRLIPYLLVVTLLWICWLLIIIGYGKIQADEFYDDALRL